MVSVFLREQRRYTQHELVEKFECSEKRTVAIIKRLKEYGVLKAVKANDVQKNLTELYDDDIEIIDVEESENEYFYVFTFVGILIINGIVLKCYPKYIKSNLAPITELRQILSVLEKYNSRKQIISMYNETTDSSAFNMLAAMLFLLNDYFEYGSYINTEDIIEANGNNEILWDKTINDTFALLIDNRPYYPELITKRTVSNEYDYFKRLHDCILTICSKKLFDADLLYLFDIDEVNLTDEYLDDFGDIDYILERILKELNIQFNTRKQLLLKVMYAFISNSSKSLDDLDCFSMFGSNNFNLVWEDVCAEILNNQLCKPICQLSLPTTLKKPFSKNPNRKLIDLIEKPNWVCDEFQKEAKSTLVPDIISIFKDTDMFKFIIFDAKYYCYEINENRISGNPGIESVTKQFLYQLAYKDFIEMHNISYIRNCFLMPTEKEIIINKGFVELKMLSNLNLEKIQVRLIPTKLAYSHYINNTKLNICDLKL